MLEEDQAVEETILAVELQLPAGADVGAGIGVDVGLGALHLDRLVVAGDLEWQHPGRVDNLLRHVGVDPADDFRPLAFQSLTVTLSGNGEVRPIISFSALNGVFT